jgi:hypothetical protein
MHRSGSQIKSVTMAYFDMFTGECSHLYSGANNPNQNDRIKTLCERVQFSHSSSTLVDNVLLIKLNTIKIIIIYLYMINIFIFTTTSLTSTFYMFGLKLFIEFYDAIIINNFVRYIKK